jgi:hypothetical protein
MPFPNEGGHGHDVVGTYDQFEFRSLRSSDVTLLSLNFKKFFKNLQMAHPLQQKSLKSM